MRTRSLFIDLIFLAVLYIHSINSKTLTRKTKTCHSNLFRCHSGDCIDNELSCNGKKDCDDGSDETYETCSKTSCPSYLFQCDYGGCVTFSKICDNNPDCADGSDERSKCVLPNYATGSFFDKKITTSGNPTTVKNKIIKTPSTTTEHQKPVTWSTTGSLSTESFSSFSTTTNKPSTSTINNLASSSTCTLPNDSPDFTYTINNCEEEPSDPICRKKQGDNVEEFVVLNVKCSVDLVTSSNNAFQSFCSNGEWSNLPINNSFSDKCYSKF